MYKSNSFFFLCVFSLILVFASSCKPKPVLRSGDALSAIPAGTSNVSAFNPKKLMDKADFEAVKSMDFYQDMLEKAEKEEPALASILENPENSGIDLNQNAYFFTKMSGGESMNMFGGLAFSLSDPSKFTDMLQAAKVGGFAKGNGFSYATPESGSIIAWNDQIAFIGGGGEKNSIVSTVEGFFKTSANQSMAMDPDLQKAMGGNHDIIGYANLDAYTKVLPDYAKLQLGAMGISEDDLKGNNISGFMDFNDGEIYSESHIQLAKNIEKDLNMFFKDKVSTDFSPFVPSAGLTSYLTFAMDIKGTNQLLKEKGVGGMANMALIRYGLTADDLAGALGGDIILAAYASPEKNGAEMLFATNVEDQDILEKFITAGTDNGILSSEGGGLYTLKGSSSAFDDAFKGLGAKPSIASGDAQLLISDGKLFISSRKDIIAAIKKGGYAASDRVDASKYNSLSKNIFGMYLDFQRAGSILGPMENMNFDDMEIKSSRKKSEMRMRTNDKNENSLKSIFKMINEAYKKEKLDIKIDDKDKKLS